MTAGACLIARRSLGLAPADAVTALLRCVLAADCDIVRARDLLLADGQHDAALELARAITEAEDEAIVRDDSIRWHRDRVRELGAKRREADRLWRELFRVYET